MNLVLSADLFEEITGYREPPLTPAAGEKRDSTRMPIMRRATIIRSTGGAEQTPVPVMLREISTTGISLLSPCPLRTRERFAVAVPRRDKEPLKVICSVVRCQPRGSGSPQFVIGASFVCLVTQAPRPASRAPSDAPPSTSKEDEIQRIRRAMFG